MTVETWRLNSVAWQLIYTLQKTLGGLTGAFWEARCSPLRKLHNQDGALRGLMLPCQLNGSKRLADDDDSRLMFAE